MWGLSKHYERSFFAVSRDIFCLSKEHFFRGWEFKAAFDKKVLRNFLHATKWKIQCWNILLRLVWGFEGRGEESLSSGMEKSGVWELLKMMSSLLESWKWLFGAFSVYGEICLKINFCSLVKKTSDFFFWHKFDVFSRFSLVFLLITSESSFRIQISTVRQ